MIADQALTLGAARQVLHTRSCSGVGLQFVRFLAACYLTFNMDFETVHKALISLPPPPPNFARANSFRGPGEKGFNPTCNDSWALVPACSPAWLTIFTRSLFTSRVAGMLICRP